MPERLRLLERFVDVVQFDADFEFTPTSFRDGEWLTIDCFDGWRVVLVHLPVEFGTETYFVEDWELIHVT